MADYKLFISDDCLIDLRLHAGAAWSVIKCRGKTAACTNKNNNNMYKITWEEDDICRMEKEWIHTEVLSRYMDLLRRATEFFDTCHSSNNSVFRPRVMNNPPFASQQEVQAIHNNTQAMTIAPNYNHQTQAVGARHSTP